MTNSLTTGSQRLAEAVWDVETSITVVNKVIASDPGVKALVEFTKSLVHVPAGPLTRDSAIAALKTWETGHA